MKKRWVTSPAVWIATFAAVSACGSSTTEVVGSGQDTTGDSGLPATGPDGGGGGGNSGTGGSGFIQSTGGAGNSTSDTGGANSGGQGGATAGGASAGGTSAGGTSAGGTSAGGGPVTKVTPITGPDACASTTLTASSQPLDIFIMLDKSGSMDDDTAAGGSKWDVITGALEGFTTDPSSAGIGAGLGLFSDGSNCDPSDFSTPIVPIANLNGTANGPADTINQAISNVGPKGGTPTTAALTSAVDYAQGFAKANPTHKVIVVFATDGLPNSDCDDDKNGSVTAAAAVAAAARAGSPGVPSVETYVIGIFGEKDCDNGVLDPNCTAIKNMNTIAKSGGSGSAFVVDPGSTNTQQAFTDAMNAIRNANNVACNYKVPAPAPGKVVDFTHASVIYTPDGKAAAAAVTLPWTAAKGSCSKNAPGGWYYDSVAAPKGFVLCDETCNTVRSDPKAKVQVLLACEPPGTPPGGGGSGGKGGTGNGGTGNGGTGNGGTGNGGTGNGGTGNGGTGNGNGGTNGTGGTAPQCLLNGQSCSSSSQCCAGSCFGSRCTQIM